MKDSTLNNTNKRPFFSVDRVEPMFLGKSRDWSVDVLRCLSCFMVCAIHSSNVLQGHEIEGGGQNIWLYHEVYRMILASPTVLFVMVSGIFFLSPERNVTAPKVWKNNILKMALAYVFWSLIYALYRMYQTDSSAGFTWGDLIQQWIFEPPHLWYIPMIIGLYMIAPILRPITASGDTKLFRYMIALFVGAMVLWTIYNWPPVVEESTKRTLLEKTPMLLLCQYPLWMLFGWIAYTYRPTRGFRYLIYALGVLAALAGIGCNIYNWNVSDTIDMVAVTQKFAIFQFFKNTALFYFVITVFRNHEFSRITKIIIRKWSDCTLIIYLIHLLLIYIMIDNNFLFKQYDLSPWAGVWIYAGIAYLVGGLVAIIFHLFWDPIKKDISDNKSKKKAVKKERAQKKEKKQKIRTIDDKIMDQKKAVAEMRKLKYKK